MLKPEQKQTLNETELSKFLGQDELDLLFTHGKILHFSKGEIILHQGKESNGIFLIITGQVEITAKILGEGSMQLEMLGPGKFIGEISFIEKIPCATSCIANSDVDCLIINNTYFELLTDYYPESKYKLLNAICMQVCERLKRMHDKIVAVISNTKMVEKSIFVEIIHSLTKPAELSTKENQIFLTMLKQFPCLRLFNEDEINKLISHSLLLKAPKDCTLIHKGEKSATCYIVIQGAVQSSIMHANKAAKLSVIGPATLFAGIACVDNSSSFTINFVTCEQAILLKLSDAALTYFQNNEINLWHKLFALICRSLVALEKSVDKLDIRLKIENYNR